MNSPPPPLALKEPLGQNALATSPFPLQKLLHSLLQYEEILNRFSLFSFVLSFQAKVLPILDSINNRCH